MGLFDIFKKKEKEPEYDVTNMSINDLDEGFIFEYDMKSWVVKEVYEYDWGNNNISREYLIDSGDEKRFLSVEEDGEFFMTVTKSIKIRKLGEDIIDKTIKKERPPKKLDYEGVTYYLDTDNAGYFNDKSKGTDDWQELINWDYFDDEEKLIISITQWGQREFDASAGKVIQEYEISNIIPGGNS